MKKAGRGKVLLCVVFALAAAILLTFAFSQKLTVREFTEKTDKVTGDVKIMVLSDLHDTFYGEGQKKLIGMIQEIAPDVILFAGDILDDKIDTGASDVLFEAVGEKYPCYYVTGNHEIWSGKAEEMKKQIQGLGVNVLEGTSDVIMVNNQYIRICGVDDPEIGNSEWNSQIAACDGIKTDNIYTILLTHRPEQIMRYHGYDLIVAGHTHGGVLRIPYLMNGLYAPGQGWFPEYGGGRYEFEDKTMIVSRGMSKGGVPRIFTPPELVVATIEGEEF